jgi:hypothetical protein
MMLLNSCSEDQNDNTDNKNYSIKIGEFTSLNNAKSYVLQLDKKILARGRILKANDRLYKVLLVKYQSSFEAGMEAFRFYRDSLIRSYSIYKNQKETVDDFRNLLFVANYDGRPSVYSFDLLKKGVKVIWSRWGSKVISFNTSFDRSSAFITSALSYGKRRGLPYILDVHLFFLNRAADYTEEVGDLGDGTQLYTYWEMKDTFKVNITSIDTVNSGTVSQEIYSFSSGGKPGKVTSRNFDLLKEGFPYPPKRNPALLSPGKRYQARQVVSVRNNYIYLKDLEEKSEVLISSSKRKIYDARWSDDGNYLFIVTENSLPVRIMKKSEPTGELIVVDARQMKQVITFSSFRFGNLLVQGNFLFFDERLNDLSRIGVYDFEQNKFYYTISIPGGCGLFNLPM